MLSGYRTGDPQWQRGGKETASTIKIGEIFILEESSTNPAFFGIPGKVVDISDSGRSCAWAPIEEIPGYSRVGQRWDYINISRLIRCGPSQAHHNTIIGWFPKRPGMEDAVADVSWNPYE